MKKVLSLVLVIAMVLSSMSFAFAAKFEDVNGDYTKAVDALSALGIVNGFEDGTFRPENSLKRGELAKLLVEALGYGNLVAGSASNFSDMKGHWADGHVAIAAGTGLVAGYPDGTFKPEKVVTYDEALTMVIRALGYTDASLKGTWPTNYKVKAIDLGLTKNVKMAKVDADRGGVAQVIYNALEAKIVEVSDKGVATPVTTGALILLDKVATLEENFVVKPEHLDKDNKNYAGNLVDLAPYMYQDLKVYLNDDDEVVYIKGSNSIVVEGTVDSKTATSFVVKDAADKKHTIQFAASEVMFYNGAETATIATIADINTNFESIKVIGKETDTIGNDNGRLDLEVEMTGLVVLEQTKVAVVEKEYVAGKTKVDVFTLPTKDNKPNLSKITVEGAVDTLEDIKVDDVVVEYLAKNSSVTKLVVSRDKVEGKVTRITTGTSADSYYIDGVKYTENKLVTLSLSIASDGTFFLDHNSKIVDFKGSESSPTDYAVIIGTHPGSRVNKFGYSVDKYPQVKIATQDNETVVLDVYVGLNSSGAVDTDKVATINNDTTYLVANGVSDALNLTNMPANGQIVKYKLNKDGQLVKLETLVQPTLTTVKTENLKFADNVIVFDSGDADYPVVDLNKVEADLTSATVVYNSKGLIEVVLTNEIEDSTSKTYAFLNGFDVAYNGSDKVQLATIIMNGQKVEKYTDAASLLVSGDLNKVFAFGFDGDVVTSKANPVVVKNTTTATAIIASSGMIKFANTVTAEGSATIAAGTWISIAEDVTIMKAKTDGSYDKLADLYDIEANVTSLHVYLNSDKEVAFIVLP